MKLNNTQQLILTVVLLFLGNILGTLYHTWIFRSVALVVGGLLWIINPVLANHVHATKARVRWAQIAGVILILMGVFTRLIVW